MVCWKPCGEYLRHINTVLTVISGVETADVTDAANPLIHLLFCVSHQVEDAIYGLDIENEAVLQVLLVERQPSIHLEGKRTLSSEGIFKSSHSALNTKG